MPPLLCPGIVPNVKDAGGETAVVVRIDLYVNNGAGGGGAGAAAPPSKVLGGTVFVFDMVRTVWLSGCAHAGRRRAGPPDTAFGRPVQN